MIVSTVGSTSTVRTGVKLRPRHAPTERICLNQHLRPFAYRVQLVTCATKMALSSTLSHVRPNSTLLRDLVIALPVPKATSVQIKPRQKLT